MSLPNFAAARRRLGYLNDLDVADRLTYMGLTFKR
jgi:hypothetical protein